MHDLEDGDLDGDRLATCADADVLHLVRRCTLIFAKYESQGARCGHVV